MGNIDLEKIAKEYLKQYKEAHRLDPENLYEDIKQAFIAGFNYFEKGLNETLDNVDKN